jgi:ketosteroid isomerase-like protein
MSAGRCEHEHLNLSSRDSEGPFKGLFSCIDGGDWAWHSDFLHDEAIYGRPGYEPFVGKPAIVDFCLTKRIVSLGQYCVEKVLSEGANITCSGSFSGVAKDGRNLSMRFADVHRIRDGIDLRWTFFDSPVV